MSSGTQFAIRQPHELYARAVHNGGAGEATKTVKRNPSKDRERERERGISNGLERRQREGPAVAAPNAEDERAGKAGSWYRSRRRLWRWLRHRPDRRWWISSVSDCICFFFFLLVILYLSSLFFVGPRLILLFVKTWIFIHLNCELRSFKLQPVFFFSNWWRGLGYTQQYQLGCVRVFLVDV